MNTQSCNDISICVFGSSARASTDHLSDRDVLIVAADIRNARVSIDEWVNLGWSVSTYSRSRLQGLSNAGSLFVKHLQDEGNIVCDPSGWLQDTFDNFQPKDCYKIDVEESLELAKPVERLMVAGKKDRASGLIADLAYVFLRNYAIYRCASAGTYLFDYAALLEELQGYVKFTDKCRNGLLGLREGKHGYRAGVVSLYAEGYTRRCIDWLNEACPDLDLCPIRRDTPIRMLSTKYSVLRDCEAALWVNGFQSIQKPMSPERAAIWKMIQNPRDYSWHIKRIDENWVARANMAIFGFPSTRKLVG